MRRSLPPMLLLLALAAAGCGSPCQELADRVCDCQTAGPLRDSCKSAVGSQISSGAQRPESADQSFCESKLATCPEPLGIPGQCELLQTAAGKEACGLSYPPAG
jgi:hypothetical protein